MNKTEFIDAIASNGGITKEMANKSYTAMVATITEAMAKNDKITLPGFGIFTLKERAARTGLNPKTGAALQIAASKTVAFKPSKALKDSVQ